LKRIANLRPIFVLIKKIGSNEGLLNGASPFVTYWLSIAEELVRGYILIEERENKTGMRH
jgi:hypothetical protein